MSRLAKRCCTVLGSFEVQPPAAEWMEEQFDYRRERQLLVDGVLWTVYEHVMNYDRAPSTTLVFDRPGLVRRVRTFPPNWIELDERTLIALSDRT